MILIFTAVVYTHHLCQTFFGVFYFYEYNENMIYVLTNTQFKKYLISSNMKTYQAEFTILDGVIFQSEFSGLICKINLEEWTARNASEPVRVWCSVGVLTKAVFSITVLCSLSSSPVVRGHLIISRPPRLQK